jgi:hypothetical protein
VIFVPKALLDLQLVFAARVCELSSIPFERALLEYTNLYIRLGLGHSFDAAHATWRAYLAGLRTAGDAEAYTYDYYLRAAKVAVESRTLGRFGCFSWGREGDAIRLHFMSETPSEVSPLDGVRHPERRTELLALFTHVRSIVGEGSNVTGVSWLYNREAYRRLFPPAYVESARVARGRFRGMSLWGQFLNRRGELHVARAAKLSSALAAASSTDELDRCFPFPVLAAEAPVRAFYDFFGL